MLRITLLGIGVSCRGVLLAIASLLLAYAVTALAAGAGFLLSLTSLALGRVLFPHALAADSSRALEEVVMAIGVVVGALAGIGWLARRWSELRRHREADFLGLVERGDALRGRLGRLSGRAEAVVAPTTLKSGCLQVLEARLLPMPPRFPKRWAWD